MPIHFFDSVNKKTIVYEIEAALRARGAGLPKDRIAFVTIGRNLLSDIIPPADSPPSKYVSRRQGAFTLNSRGDIHYIDFSSAGHKAKINLPRHGTVIGAANFPFKVENEMTFAIGPDKNILSNYNFTYYNESEEARPAEAAEGSVQPDESSDSDKLREIFNCAICYDVILNSYALTKCGHCFCGNCLTRWFLRSGKTNCPTCRAESPASAPAGPVLPMDQAILHHFGQGADEQLARAVTENDAHRQIEFIAKSLATVQSPLVVQKERRGTKRAGGPNGPP